MTCQLPKTSPFSEEEKEQLGNEITLMAGQMSVIQHRFLKKLAHFNLNLAWQCDGTVKSCAHWLNWKCGLAKGAAREKIRVAMCLEDLPKIDAAFGKGEISYSKVRAMTRIATVENEDYLLSIARHGTATHIEQLVRKYRNVLRSESREHDINQQEARSLTYFQEDDGMITIHATLPPEPGALVIRVIQALARPVQEIRQQEQQTLYEEARAAAEAKMANTTGEAEILNENDSTNVPAETLFSAVMEEERTVQTSPLMVQTQADALITLAEHFLASGGTDVNLKGLSGAERCQIMLHVDINTLREGLADSELHSHCHLDHEGHPGHVWLHPSTARRLACDASLITVLEDADGHPLNIGRRSRTLPKSMHRALTIRDPMCRFPGCCESRYNEAHHIHHWANGGETNMGNLVHLCRRHHDLLHAGSYSIKAEPNELNPNAPHLTFETPTGIKIQETLYPQFPPQVAASALSALAQAAPDINAETIVPRMDGVRCDYGMAVDGLLRRDPNRDLSDYRLQSCLDPDFDEDAEFTHPDGEGCVAY